MPHHNLFVTQLLGFVLPDKLQARLRGEGGIKALLGMVRCGHPDVLAQVARGIANFAKCESRAATQGNIYACTLCFVSSFG
jgi:hypothetical protein